MFSSPGQWYLNAGQWSQYEKGVDREAYDAYMDWSKGQWFTSMAWRPWLWNIRLRNECAAVIQRHWARYTKRKAHLRSLFGFSNGDPYDSPG